MCLIFISGELGFEKIFRVEEGMTQPSSEPKKAHVLQCARLVRCLVLIRYGYLLTIPHACNGYTAVNYNILLYLESSGTTVGIIN